MSKGKETRRCPACNQGLLDPCKVRCDLCDREMHPGRLMEMTCAICRGWIDIDEIVWRGPNRTIPICADCEPEGDDCR